MFWCLNIVLAVALQQQSYLPSCVATCNTKPGTVKESDELVAHYKTNLSKGIQIIAHYENHLLWLKLETVSNGIKTFLFAYVLRLYW